MRTVCKRASTWSLLAYAIGPYNLFRSAKEDSMPYVLFAVITKAQKAGHLLTKTVRIPPCAKVSNAIAQLGGVQSTCLVL